MKISVITPTYNRQSFLNQAMDSFLAQDYEDKEMIVVNDGGSVPTVPDGIKLFNLEHGNQSIAQNYGIKKSEGELICTLDDDDLFYDNTSLSQRVDYFKRNKDVEVIWTNARDIHADGGLSTEHELSDGSQVWTRDNIFINSMMWKKSIRNQIGGYFFDRDLTSNEDWDFKIRCIEDCACMAIDILTVKHRVHGEMRSNLHRGTGELVKNETIFRTKLNKRYGKS